MKNLCFSVIMPCYNSEAYVTKAIESVVNQTYPHWELLVINDGSYDNTLNIVNQYSAADPRIKVFSKENGGYATAINYGLDRVGGDYFLFMGSDDYLDLHLFEKLSTYFCEYQLQPDLVAFRTRLVTQDGTVKEIEPYTNFEKALLTEASFQEFNAKHPQYAAIFSIRDTSRCYKTSLLGDTRYFGKTGVDADGIFSMLICHKAQSFLNIPVDGYYWYVREGSVSSSTTLAKHLDRIKNWHSFFEVLSSQYESEITQTERQYLASLSRFIVELSSTPGNALKYWKFIRQEAKFAIQTAKKFDVELLRYIHTVVKMPVAFSLVFLLHSMIKRENR